MTHPKPGWASKSLSIASDQVDDARDYAMSVMGMLENLAYHIETADKAYQAASEPHEVFWMQFAEDGSSIRRWSRTPFEGARQCRVAIPNQDPIKDVTSGNLTGSDIRQPPKSKPDQKLGAA